MMRRGGESGEVQTQIKTALEKLGHLMRQQESVLEQQGVTFNCDPQHLHEMGQANKIQEFLEMLKHKYLKLAEKLKEEQEKREYAEVENIALKSHLAAELEKHEELVKAAKSELSTLMEKNQRYMEEVQEEERTKEALEKELLEKERAIDILTSTLKKRMEDLAKEKERKKILEQQFCHIHAEFEGAREVYEAEKKKGVDLEESFRTLEQEYNQAFKKLKALTDKQHTLKSQLDKSMQEHMRLEDDKKRAQEEVSANERKLEGFRKKLGEQAETQERLTQEIAVKNDEMSRIRQENGEIEGKLKGLKTIEAELQRVLEVKNKLLIENEILCHQLRNALPGADLSKLSYKEYTGADLTEKRVSESLTPNQIRSTVLDKSRSELPNMIVSHEGSRLQPSEESRLNSGPNQVLVEDTRTIQLETQGAVVADQKKSLDIDLLQHEMTEKLRLLKEKDENVGNLGVQIEMLLRQIQSISEEKQKLSSEYNDLQRKVVGYTQTQQIDQKLSFAPGDFAAQGPAGLENAGIDTLLNEKPRKIEVRSGYGNQ